MGSIWGTKNGQLVPLGALLVLATFLSLYSTSAAAQPFDLNESGNFVSGNLDTSAGPEAELHLGRVVFGQSMQNGFGRGRGRSWWAIDWPEAEAHITDGVQRMSLIDVAEDSRHIRLDDPNLYDYPWLFLQQIGQASFSTTEIDALREYLLRGGFVLVDDFHGLAFRQSFVTFAARIFPDRPLVPIPVDDVVMSIHYDLNQDTQIPGSRHLRGSSNGEVVAQMEGKQEWLGLYDDLGNLVLAGHVNMDMGDAWQHADDPYYPEPMTNLAYRFGLNYFIYAMTH